MKQTQNYWKQLLTILLVLTCSLSYSQEFYFTDLGEATLNKKKAKTIITLSKKKNKILLNAFLMVTENTAAKIGYKKGRIVNDSTLIITVKKENKVAYKMKRQFKKIDSKTYMVKDFDKHGNIAFIGKASSYFPLIKNGWAATFYRNGQVASTGIYNNNKLLINENWTHEGEKTFSNAFSITSAIPTVKDSKENYIYALGKYIQKSIKKRYKFLQNDELNYFRRHNLNISFIVNKDGKIEVTSVDGNFPNNFKADVVSALEKTSGNWKPGYINSLAVNTKLTLPLNVIAYNDYRLGSSDHINHWFFLTDIPVRLYRW